MAFAYVAQNTPHKVLVCSHKGNDYHLPLTAETPTTIGRTAVMSNHARSNRIAHINTVASASLSSDAVDTKIDRVYVGRSCERPKRDPRRDDEESAHGNRGSEEESFSGTSNITSLLPRRG
jgi:hypothetical protein